MTLRIISSGQLAHVSPAIRAQIERELGNRAADVLTQTEEPESAAPVKAVLPVRRGQPEQEAGRLLVEWIDSLLLPNGLRPGLFFAHVANAGVAEGKVRGGILQGQGVRKGWPDYILDLPFGRYHGFRLELKAEGGAKPSQEQLDTLERLESVGFKCAVAWGFDEAKRAIEDYLDLAR